ncbi:hypothetical protein X975_15051, partial [Stegodyphus mimosarum]
MYAISSTHLIEPKQAIRHNQALCFIHFQWYLRNLSFRRQLRHHLQLRLQHWLPYRNQLLLLLLRHLHHHNHLHLLLHQLLLLLLQKIQLQLLLQLLRLLLRCLPEERLQQRE